MSRAPRSGSPQGLAGIEALVETPAFYPSLSGRDNPRLARHAGVPDTRIQAILDEVELMGCAGDPFGNYSLGMKQRVGVTAALLKDPQLVIVDEPTDGRTPRGWRRYAPIRRLGQNGRTYCSPAT